MPEPIRIKFKDTWLYPVPCPACLKKLDGAMSITGKEPVVGSLTFCDDCGAILAFEPHLAIPAALTLRHATEKERELAETKLEFQVLRSAWQAVKREKRAGSN